MDAWWARTTVVCLLFDVAVLIFSPASGRLCLAQESDAILSDVGRPSFTLADQISDPVERKAFVSLYATRDPIKKAKLAEAFIARYPRSWFLAQVYEIAAKANIETGDYDRALAFGRQSLRLLPENPLLLVSLANVQVQRGFITEAQQSARDGLRYLNTLGRPSSISMKSWPALERQMEASCYFVLGRAAASKALNLPAGVERLSSLQRSLDFLERAEDLNPQDPEITYLEGLVKLAMKRPEDAAFSFAATYRQNGVLKTEALEQLKKIYLNSPDHRTAGFQAFLTGLEGRERNSAPHAFNQHREAGNSLPDYVGSETCRKCHPDIYRAWSQTGMARMFRPYRPENVIGDFERNNEFYEGDEVRLENGRLEIVQGRDRVLFARAVVDQGRHYFEIKQSDGLWHRFPVDYTIGSKWQQAYATKLRSGEIHVFPVQYNAVHNQWINYWKIIDVRGSERANVSTWEKLDASTSYQANCAACHTSQLSNEMGGGFEPDNLVFREPGVNCEMCHGPGGRHVSSILSGNPHSKHPLDPPVDFGQISSQDSVAICAQCHMQSALRVPGPHGELNYSREGQDFFPRFKARPYGEFSLEARYKDDRFRQTTFMVEALERSQCFQKGGVTCVSCHDPHPADASINKTSLSFRDNPDQMCLQCHKELAGKIESHTHHPSESEASRCVSCHMPRIMNALLFTARTHQIDDIPDAGITAQFGLEDSPNACLMCHRDKDTSWLKQQLVGWTEVRPSPEETQPRLEVRSRPGGE